MLRKTREVVTTPLVVTASITIKSTTTVRTFGAASRSNDHDSRYGILKYYRAGITGGV